MTSDVPSPSRSRRQFLHAATLAAGATAIAGGSTAAAQPAAPTIVRPPVGKPLLLGTKLSMIAKDEGGRALSLPERLKMAAAAGFDGVDFDEAGSFTAEEARTAVQETGVFVHYDLGNHWRIGQPGEWMRAFGHRCVKLDVKGYGRGVRKMVDITSEHDDLPWDQVRRVVADIGFVGWATAEVGGGNLERLTLVRQQMQKAFGLA